MSKRWDEVQCQLRPDTNGVIWDLALYVPTVGFLILWGLKLWFINDEDQVIFAYGLLFLGFFFLMAGGNRIGRRLLLLPSAPVALDVTRDKVRLQLKGGESVSLIKDVRFFTDYAGKSFGLSGMDAQGASRQFVFHRKQFDEAIYEGVVKALEKYR
jgi:hypothetical protein